MSGRPPLADERLDPVVIGTRRGWTGFRRLDVIDAEVTLDAGRGPSRLSHEIVRVGQIVAVLPYDPARNRLLLIRQFRMGAHLATGLGLNVEVIAGRVDVGEDIAAAARREAMEEGGIACLDLEPMLDFVPVPAALDERAQLFLARADLGGAREVTGLPEEQEVILPFLVTPEDAFAAARAGVIRNGYTLLAIAWFMLHKAEIDQRWKEHP